MDYVDNIGVLVAALAALMGAIWTGVRTRADVARIRDELTPSGSTVAAARTAVILDRLDKRLGEVATSVGGIRDDARLDRADVRTLSETVHARLTGIATRLDRLEARVSRCPHHTTGDPHGD